MLFAAGGAGGAVLGRALAGDSELAVGLTAFAFALSMIMGWQAWLGTAILWACARLLKIGIDKVRGKGWPKPRTEHPDELFVPPGSWVFALVSPCLLLATGFVVALLSRRASLAVGILVYPFVGLAYGALLWQAARRGYLPFPEEG